MISREILVKLFCQLFPFESCVCFEKPCNRAMFYEIFRTLFYLLMFTLNYAMYEMFCLMVVFQSPAVSSRPPLWEIGQGRDKT